jgi:hypothetical protein
LVEIEHVRDEGRTDIEIKQRNKFHIIIECKIRSNRVKKQKKQYLKSFENELHKILCFITQQNDYKILMSENIEIRNLGWINVANLLDSKKFAKSEYVREFLSFARKGFEMRDQKEILVQDLGRRKEIKRFKDYQVYRRDAIYGSPLYFSPYFTRLAKQPEGEGILYLSKILGIITTSPKYISNFIDDLNKFTQSQKLIKRWMTGVKLDIDAGNKIFTYFFLDQPIKLGIPLKKDGGIKKGRGRNWIAASIPKNRCVSFSEFTKRIIKESSRESSKIRE